MYMQGVWGILAQVRPAVIRKEAQKAISLICFKYKNHNR